MVDEKDYWDEDEDELKAKPDGPSHSQPAEGQHAGEAADQYASDRREADGLGYPDDEGFESSSRSTGNPDYEYSGEHSYDASETGYAEPPLQNFETIPSGPIQPESSLNVSDGGSASGDTAFRNPQRWVVIGPSGSGKSAFVSSLEQVVATGTEDGRDLRIDARNSACQELFTAAIDRLLDNPLTSTAEATELRFTLEARVRPGSGDAGAPFRVMNVELADAAGKWMFSSTGEHLTSDYATSGLDKLAARWPTADSLLVMVPSYRASDNPVPINQEIRSGLSHLLQKMRTRHAIEAADSRTWWRRRWDSMRGRTVELPKARRLAFKRVLICVTMADVLAEQLLRDFQEWKRCTELDPESPLPCPLPSRVAAIPNLTAREIAESLEPVATVRRKISDAAIQQILDAVAPGCPVAVALMSVKGFNEDGDPLTDMSGLANPASGGAKTQRWRERVVNDWQPWGVRAALYFLATGTATPGAPLEILSAERLQEHR
jgi:hypothetical protein